MINFLKSEKFILPIVYLIIGFILIKIAKYIIGKVSKHKLIDKKKKTIISLIKNIINYLIYIFVILSILSVYGVDTSGIIASLGIAGLVIGLALQDIIADFVSGIFILFDNQYTIGDTVKLDDFTGEVISFGLMSTKIKAATGEILIISNSSFSKVINYSQANPTITISLDVAYDTDIAEVEKVLNKLETVVMKWKGVISYSPLGINELSSSSMKYLVSITCKLNYQYKIKRDYLRLVKETFDKEKIMIPYNRLDVSIKKDDIDG